jgi:hypothetical protein
MRPLLVTASNVVFMLYRNENKLFEPKSDSQRRSISTPDLPRPGSEARHLSQYQEGRTRVTEGKDNPAANKECQKAPVELDEAGKRWNSTPEFWLQN